MKPYFEESGITIYLGDCVEILPTLDPPFDAIITDPPYNVSVRGGRTNTTIGKIKRKDGTHRDIIREFGAWDFEFDPTQFLAESVRLLCEGGSLVAFTSEFLIAAYLSSGLAHRCLAYWHKSNPAPNFRRLYSRCVEMIVWQTKGGGWTFNGGGYVPNLFRFPILNADREHPTQKPIELMIWLVGTHSNPADLILDPFLGSGTTLLAAKELGRRAVGIEKIEEYAEVAANRLRQSVMQFGGSK